MKQIDIFGNIVENNPLLRDKYIEPPFSVLDTKTANWQRRKKLWKKLGIKSEVGRDKTKGKSQWNDLTLNERRAESTKKIAQVGKTASIFDPALCEVLYHWFCPKNGKILDPFAGGSVRGIVANYLGYKYTGIDIRQEQINSNREQGLNILDLNNQPQWYVGDSNEVLNRFTKDFDFVFSCPPYSDLEVYSDLESDISNMNYTNFLKAYESIIFKSCSILKSGGYACFVISEIRDNKGNYRGFVPDTIMAFQKANMNYYNEAVLLKSIGSGSLRAENTMKNKKLVKVHETVLIFKKN